MKLDLISKATFVFVLFATFVLAGVGLLAYQSGRASLKNATISELLSRSLEKQAAMDHWVEDHQIRLATIANSPGLAELVGFLNRGTLHPAAVPARRQVSELLHLYRGQGQFLELFVIEPEQGQILFSTRAEAEGEFKSDRPYFLNGKFRSYAQPPHYSPALGALAMTLSTPVHTETGELVGVLVGRLDLRQLNRIISRRTGLQRSDDAYLVNQSGQYITQPRFMTEPVILQQDEETPVIQECRANNSGVLFGPDYRGVPVISVHQWMPTHELCLIVEVDQEEAYAPARQFGQTLLLISTLVLASASALAYVLARAIIRPVQALQAGAARLARGELGARLPEHSEDELGLLAREFNVMAAAIAEQKGQLRAYAARLEREVQVRTRELRASEAELRALFTAMTDIICVLSAEGEFLKIAPTKPKVEHRPTPTLIGKRLHDLFPAAQADRFVSKIRYSLATAQATHVEFSYLIQGEESWFSATISPVDAEAILWVARDITDLKRSEQMLEKLSRQNELLLNSAGEGIYGIDLQGMITFINPAAARMTGHTVEALIGRPVHPLLHAHAEEQSRSTEAACAICASVKDGLAHEGVDEIFWRKDGSHFPVDYTSMPLMEQGRLVGAVITFKDITERRQVERLKEEFISVVSHELRTPLTSIRGALTLLASGVLGTLPERGHRMVEIATANTDRLARLINDILDIDRLEAGKLSMTREDCSASSLMERAVESMSVMAEKAGVHLVVEPLQVSLHVDPDRTLQVLTNLLSNAIKFSPRNTTVWLSAERQPNHLLIKVRDEGRGIPGNMIDHIFERFQQVDSSDAREKMGAGLGLAISRSIVQQHGGQIWVESRVGEGSTFFFTLPLSPREFSRSDPVAPPVLVCDDDAFFRNEIAELLERGGYRAMTAASGAEAIRLAATERPAVILLDLVMPGMDGWETMAALKEQPETQHIPIIVCSGILPEEGENPDIVDWVLKPFDEDSLLQVASRAMGLVNRMPRLLLVEDDVDLAKVLAAMFEQHGVQSFHAQTSREAIDLIQSHRPNLLVLDLFLPEEDGFVVVEWLRSQGWLHELPVVVYTVKDLDGIERARLNQEQIPVYVKGRIPPEELEQRVITLLGRMIPKEAERKPDESQADTPDRG